MKPAIEKLLRRSAGTLQFIKRPLEAVFHLEAAIAAAWATNAHKRLFLVQWGISPQPEYFDHQIDLYFAWRESRDAAWLERGIFNSLALKGGVVLELGCGDGFNARNFYSVRAAQVVACDRDRSAIARARRRNSAQNITYVLADVRTDMPAGPFQNIVCDAAIDYFTPVELERIVVSIKTRLTAEGVFSGFTIAGCEGETDASGPKRYKFGDKEALVEFLKPYFRRVLVLETVSPRRRNLYFFASDAAVPLCQGWEHMVGTETTGTPRCAGAAV